MLFVQESYVEGITLMVSFVIGKNYRLRWKNVIILKTIVTVYNSSKVYICVKEITFVVYSVTLMQNGYFMG